MSTLNDARWLLSLFGPTLEDSTQWTCAVHGGQLAVILLGDPAKIEREDYWVALRVWERLPDCGLLIVL